MRPECGKAWKRSASWHLAAVGFVLVVCSSSMDLVLSDAHDNRGDQWYRGRENSVNSEKRRLWLSPQMTYKYVCRHMNQRPKKKRKEQSPR